MNEQPKRTSIVIIGGGFAGIAAVRKLQKSGQPIDITMVSKSPNFQYYPSLYRMVVGASVNQVSIPLTKIVSRNVRLVIDTYTGVDTQRKAITLQSGTEISYDYLVMALGSEPNYFGIDGMETHSKSFLSVDKARGLNQYYKSLIGSAKTLPRDEALMKLRTIIVGAGPSGVELAGVLRGYLVQEARRQKVDPTLIKIDLLDSGPRVLAAIPERASALVRDQLQRKGVTVYSNYGVNACDENCVIVADKNNPAAPVENIHMEAGTVIWTAGTKISTAFAAIPGVTMTDRKRVVVTPTLTLPTDDTLYVAGDGSGTPYSGLAQTAIDQGDYVAETLLRRIAGKSVAPYEPKQGVFVIPVGKHWAILNYKDIVLYGFFPWILRIMIDARYFLSITSLWNVLGMLRNES